ncbi:MULTISPECIES: protein YgfX [unclassified Massilia]|uniref:protein YgfX n=1 Tax=unclassified Massilia TaxID=2609279 RepID=UPI001B83FE13|nr:MULTISPECIES: protein YgfX [unclassified Massilia]MBQ5938905.1 hypothetical protein [Massilia sp. AB1]MBQ5961914.1 hypothetical protein [Massilia sp. ZL223]
MPITVTAVVAPSRRLRVLLAAFCASLFAASVAVGLLLPGRFLTGAWLPLLLAAIAVAHALGSGNAAVRRIDFSGVGTLRLTVQRNVHLPTATSASLLPGATVWPCCMLLRLRAGESGDAWRLVLLPDSLGPSAYRELAVALRHGGAVADAAGGAAGAGVSAKIL